MTATYTLNSQTNAQATVGSLMFIENIIKADSLSTAHSPSTQSPQEVPSPDRGLSPTCSAEVGGNHPSPPPTPPSAQHRGWRRGESAGSFLELPPGFSRTQTYPTWQSPTLREAVSPVLSPPARSLYSPTDLRKPRSCHLQAEKARGKR